MGRHPPLNNHLLDPSQSRFVEQTTTSHYRLYAPRSGPGRPVGRID